MTLFDIITVACFVGVVILFFVFTDQSPRLLLRFVLVGIVLAAANQIGNHGYVFIAAGLVAAAMTFIAVQFVGRS